MTSISQVWSPRGCAGSTVVMFRNLEMVLPMALTLRAAGVFAVGASTTTRIGEVVWAGKSWARASETTRAGAPEGSTLASTVVNLMPRKGAPRASRNRPVATAKKAGRAITAAARRCQFPDVALSSAALRRKESQSTRGPSRRRTAGSTVSAIKAATIVTAIPPYPIEYRKRWGKSSSEAIAAATVSELKMTVRPALRMVLRKNQQAVVDRQAQPQAGHQVEGEDRKVRGQGDQTQAQEGADYRDAADHQREHRRYRAAEDHQQQDEEDWERQRLRLGEVCGYLLFDLGVGQPGAADGHL